MASYRGKDLVVQFNSVDISGDGRTFSFEESADALDTSGYGDTRRTYIPGLEDASASFEAMDQTGAWSTAWDEVAVGSSATIVVRPEGTGTGLRELSATGIVTGRSLSVPYDDIAMLSVEFQISGVVTEIEQA